MFVTVTYCMAANGVGEPDQLLWADYVVYIYFIYPFSLSLSQVFRLASLCVHCSLWLRVSVCTCV